MNITTWCLVLVCCLPLTGAAAAAATAAAAAAISVPRQQLTAATAAAADDQLSQAKVNDSHKSQSTNKAAGMPQYNELFSAKEINKDIAGSTQKNHRILHQGINLDVSNILDDVESLVHLLHKIIYGSSFVKKTHVSRGLQTYPQHRMSSIISNLLEIFPHAHERVRRSSNDGNNSSFAEYSQQQNDVHDSIDEDDTGMFESFLQWFNLGSDVTNFWRISLHTLSQSIADSNVTEEYIDVLNDFLAPLNVRIAI